MIIGHFMLNVIEANAFIIGCTETREAALIDAGEFHPAIPEFVEAHGLDVKTIFITHDHHDHVAGLEEAAKHFGARTIAGTECPGGFSVDRVVAHGDEVTVGRHTGRVVDTSGHTPVGYSLIFPGTVFTGDALFSGSVGGTSGPDQYQHQLDLIRKNLFTLPPDYEIHVGHGPSSTIGIESKYNPFFV